MERTRLKTSYFAVNPARLVEARGSRRPAQVAAELGYPRQFLWDWENGRKRIPDHAMKKICELYRRPLEFFFN
jgi:transcriptional regulator with XRE-family HTH domain